MEENRKVCFIVSPIGNESTEIRQSAELISDVLLPVLHGLDYLTIAPYEISKPGMITSLAIEYLLSAELVIVNLTGLHPNVMYQLAVRHSKMLPVVCIAGEGTMLPFEMAGVHTVFFKEEYNVLNMVERLKEIIVEALKETTADNPVSRVAKWKTIHDSLSVSSDDIQAYLLRKVDEMSRQLNLLCKRDELLAKMEQLSINNEQLEFLLRQKVLS